MFDQHYRSRIFHKIINLYLKLNIFILNNDSKDTYFQLLILQEIYTINVFKNNFDKYRAINPI
jgi:hypothetical protein